MKSYIISAIVATLIAFTIIHFNNKTEVGHVSTQSAFDRVMATNTLRCGYYVFPPVTNIDPKTNKLSGMAVDLMNEIAKRSGLKIEWVEEVTFGNWVPALQSKRYDVACTPMWPDISAAREVAFSNPLFFSGLYPIALETDHRFDNLNKDRFNKPDVSFVSMDGNPISNLIKDLFPNAVLHNLPASTNGSVLYQELATGKAQVAISDINAVVQFNAHNDKKVKLIPLNPPLKLQAFSFAVDKKELSLLYFLNNAVNDLQYDGYIDRMLLKWEKPKDAFLRVAPQFKGPN